MALRIDVPVEVVVDAPVRSRHLTALEWHIGDAVRTALDALRNDVLVPRGRHRAVVVDEPTVQVIVETRAAVDAARVGAAVQAGVGYAVALSGIEQSVWRSPLARPAAVEHVDAARRVGTSYRVPVFDDGTPADVPLREDPSPPTVDDALFLAWQAHVQRFGAIWNPQTYGYPGFHGSFRVGRDVAHDELIYFSHVSSLDEDGFPIDWTWQKGPLYMVGYREEGDQITTESLGSAMDHYVLTRTEEPATTENLLRRAEAVAAEHEDPYPPEIRARMAARAAQPGALIHTLHDGSTTRFMSIVPGNTTSGGIAHSPIRFIAAHQFGSGGTGVGGGTEEAAGSRGAGGDGGSGGRRRRGGPLGTTEGEGSVWPVLGLGGEQLVCKPYLGEPPLASLRVGADALEQKIRSIAEQLEFDYCGFAGQFCLNAARVVGARAHAIGVASANSPTTTNVTVRPDGRGNHGYVDIQPGDAPEFEYLRSLGDLAVQVNQLANLIGNVYLLPANRDLVHWDADREYDPNAASWLLRFWREMDALDTSCMWLFAETCRVLLLQQLRSSREGITGRQQRFEQTLESFTRKLDILGESVVKMSVLKRAVEHAERYDLSGSVRSVLAHAPPPRSMGRGEYYEPPAPITAIADRILEVLADATIVAVGDDRRAEYQGRQWTAQQLEQAVAIRRGMLNMSDPLFLQVPNLDSLYTAFERNPASSRRYLTDLLSEMLRANTGMLRKASEREKGAFFALEASQYVRTEGGWNSRGLKYDLQGIHEMADDILRPYTQGTDSYRVGINRALGIKAGWDDFVMAFSIVGIIGLALLCAPLGATVVGVVTGAAGLALTAYDISEADRMEDLYRALEDPEAILHWQDVELQRLMANLSIAFSIFDVIGVGKGARAIVTGARQGLREVAEQGLRGAARTALSASRATVLRNMAGEVMTNAVREAMQATALAGATTLLLPTIVTPVLVPWIRSVAAEHGTLPEVDVVLGQLARAGAAGAPR